MAWTNGAAPAPLAAAAALAMAPALAGFVLLPFLGRSWVGAGLAGVWLLMAIGLVGGSGGPLSPLSSTFLIVPALALALGRNWAPEAGAAAVLGYAAAAWLARLEGSAGEGLGAYPEVLGAAAIAFATGLMSLGGAGAAQTSATLGRRVAEVSHELRTPLTHILGFSEMIERQMFGEIGAKYVEYAGLIRRSGTHLLALVNDLLDLSKIEAGRYDLELQVFDVGALVGEVVRLSTDLAKKKDITLGMITPEAPLMVRADALAVRRVLINTIGNAIKFTPERGAIIVRARAEAGALLLETSDNGPGFSDEEQVRLVKAYERGSGSAGAEGAGLGLALVAALARLHGGSLRLLNSPQGGALVRVTLPVLTGGAGGS